MHRPVVSQGESSTWLSSQLCLGKISAAFTVQGSTDVLSSSLEEWDHLQLSRDGCVQRLCPDLHKGSTRNEEEACLGTNAFLPRSTFPFVTLFH